MEPKLLVSWKLNCLHSLDFYDNNLQFITKRGLTAGLGLTAEYTAS